MNDEKNNNIISPENLVYKKPELMNDTPMHYCPGCSHGVVHKLVAEVIVPLLEFFGFNLETRDKQTGRMKKSVDATVIEGQKNKHPIAKVYLRFKAAQKVGHRAVVLHQHIGLKARQIRVRQGLFTWHKQLIPEQSLKGIEVHSVAFKEVQVAVCGLNILLIDTVNQHDIVRCEL